MYNAPMALYRCPKCRKKKPFNSMAWAALIPGNVDPLCVACQRAKPKRATGGYGAALRRQQAN